MMNEMKNPEAAAIGQPIRYGTSGSINRYIIYFIT